MISLGLRPPMIIKLTAIYFVLRGLPALFLCLGFILRFLRLGDTKGFSTFIVLLIGIAISFGNAIGLSRFRSWAWRLTLIICGFAFVVTLLVWLPKAFSGFGLINILQFIVDGAIISIFWTNIEVKAALGKFKNTSASAVDANVPTV